MKNIEKIQQMSAEELAEFLENSRCCCAYNDTDRRDNRSCEQGIAAWLEQEAEKPSIFKPKEGDLFYFLDRNGDVDFTFYGNGYVKSEKLSENGNACMDKSTMEDKGRHLKLWSLLWNFAMESGGRLATGRYEIALDFTENEWTVICHPCNTKPIMPCFTSNELAQRAIDEIVIPWEKGEL